MARREKTSTTGAEKFVSWIYKHVSDYGMSIWRPLVAILLLISVYAGIYYALGGHVLWDLSSFDLFEPNFVKAMTFSWNQAFPFGDISKFKPLNSGFALQILATLQSALSLILLFLTGLAIRRRFQVG
jgi:hypothetical protein